MPCMRCVRTELLGSTPKLHNLVIDACAMSVARDWQTLYAAAMLESDSKYSTNELRGLMRRFRLGSVNCPRHLLPPPSKLNCGRPSSTFGVWAQREASAPGTATRIH
jgi:hypothetical protein